MTAAVFLAGIVMPAALRYARLFEAIGGPERLVAQELVIYEARPKVSAGYSIDQEVAAIESAMRSAGHGSFRLYGHSGPRAPRGAHTVHEESESITAFRNVNNEAVVRRGSRAACNMTARIAAGTQAVEGSCSPSLTRWPA